MKIKQVIIAVCLLAFSINASAQTDTATIKMQTMMQKILVQAPDDFKKIKGAEASRNERFVAYKVDLTKTISDPAEMKKALAGNLFGSMLTADDNIIETDGSTIYLARYDDDIISSVVVAAFKGMPVFLGADYGAKMEELKTATSTLHNYVMTVKGVNIGKLDYDESSGKCQLIIGLKR